GAGLRVTVCSGRGKARAGPRRAGTPAPLAGEIRQVDGAQASGAGLRARRLDAEQTLSHRARISALRPRPPRGDAPGPRPDGCSPPKATPSRRASGASGAWTWARAASDG